VSEQVSKLPLPKKQLKNKKPFSDTRKLLKIPERPGVYAIWKNEDLLYVGMAGRGWDYQTSKRGNGNLRSRLQNHAKARRNNILAYYLIENYVGRKISKNQWEEFKDPSKNKTLQSEVQKYINTYLSYSYAVSEIKGKNPRRYSGGVAAEWEKQLIAGVLDGIQPEFNIK
tara:strand:+ start:19 stop:528 length:510 start_codon:yes stop_codon:yes gene_type:complete